MGNNNPYDKLQIMQSYSDIVDVSKNILILYLVYFTLLKWWKINHNGIKSQLILQNNI